MTCKANIEVTRSPKSVAFPVVEINKLSLFDQCELFTTLKQAQRVPPVCCSGDVANIPVH